MNKEKCEVCRRKYWAKRALEEHKRNYWIKKAQEAAADREARKTKKI